jgi:hypothetical protein
VIKTSIFAPYLLFIRVCFLFIRKSLFEKNG